MVKIHQHVKFQAYPSMHSPATARKPLRTDGWTCRKTVMIGRVDQRTHVQVKRGYFRLRTDGQPENIMPPAPKGGGITKHNKTECMHHGTYCTLIARLMGPTWGQSWADRTQVGLMLAPWTLLSGYMKQYGWNNLFVNAKSCVLSHQPYGP